MAQKVEYLPNGLILVEKFGQTFKQCGTCYRKVEVGDNRCSHCCRPPAPQAPSLHIVVVQRPVVHRQVIMYGAPPGF